MEYTQSKKKKKREKDYDLSNEGNEFKLNEENIGSISALQENTHLRLETEDSAGQKGKKKKKKSVKSENLEEDSDPVVSLENGKTESGATTRDAVLATDVGHFKAVDTAEDIKNEEAAAHLSLPVKKRKKKRRSDRADEVVLWDDDQQPEAAAGEEETECSHHPKGQKALKKHVIKSTVAQYEDGHYSAIAEVKGDLLEVSDHSRKKHKKKKDKGSEIAGQVECSPTLTHEDGQYSAITWVEGNLLEISNHSHKKRKKKKHRWKERVGQDDCSLSITTDLARNALETVNCPKKKRKSKKNKEMDLGFEDAQDDVGFTDDLNVHSCLENETVAFHKRDMGFRKKKRRHDELLNIEELDCIPYDERAEDQNARTSSTNGVPDNSACEIESTAPHTAKKKSKKKKKHLHPEGISEEHRTTEQEDDSGRLHNSVDRNQEENLEAHAGNTSSHNEDSADPIMQEIREYLPHLKTISKGNLSLLAKHDLKRFRRFKEQGIPIKTGRFNKAENEKLRENVAFFLQASSIDTAEKLFYTARFPEEQHFIRRVKKYCHFYEIIGDGIPRSTSSIIIRAQKVFDPNNYKGRYSKEETEKLLKYQAMYGNKWRKISALLERNWREVALRFSQLGPNIQNGHWSKAEIKRLMKAVKVCVLKMLSEEDTTHIDSVYQEKGYSPALLIMKEKLYKGISWTSVATAVGTRNWMQCKLKWNSILTKKMSRGKKIYRGWRQYRAKINMIVR
ncbi:transcription termination factor 1 [Protopterus annectens]|uniref:transcription termination factor 1 n=1 Tax=Protopterus annectens TaxID=7888 RepID=UPI001CF9E520|nr:transcription termination factor 1 [Protopterus annectens]